MSKFPLNDTWKKQHAKLVTAAIKRGKISSVNVGARTGNVYFAENPQTVIKNIPFASGINVAQVSVGMDCKVDTFNETNPNNMVIAYVTGQSASPSTILVPAAVPGSSSATGTPGQVSWDASYFYICTAVNNWRRIAHSSF